MDLLCIPRRISQCKQSNLISSLTNGSRCKEPVTGGVCLFTLLRVMARQGCVHGPGSVVAPATGMSER